MDKLDNEKTAKLKHVFSCDACSFNTCKKSNYTAHLLTPKHLKITNDNEKAADNKCPIEKVYTCSCGKVYKHQSGLCKHKNKCKQIYSIVDVNALEPIQNDTVTPKGQAVEISLVFELLKQNQEFKDLMIEQSRQLLEQQNKLLLEQQEKSNNKQLLEQQNKLLMEQQEKSNHVQLQILEAVKDGKLGNNNTNCHNKFNLNVFLNETCKDAITMNDFISSMEVTMEDFIETGKVGFVDGISKVMIERIRDMELHTRPMHCTDLKRETVYIKNEEKWEKDDTDKTSLRNAVKHVAKKNYRQLKPWFDSSQPQVEQLGTEECDNYFQYYKAALGGHDRIQDAKFEDKIMKNVIRQVVVDKDAAAAK